MWYFNKLVQSIIALFVLTLVLAVGSAKANEVIQLSANDNLIDKIAEKPKGSEHWFSYQVRMEPNNGMPCCFYNQGSQGDSKQGCSLAERTNSWGSSYSDVKVDSKTLDIYFKTRKGIVEDLFIAGSECPVNKNGLSVTRFSNVGQQQSVEFLAKLIQSDGSSKQKREQTSSQALAAIAHHQGDFAHQQLVGITKKSGHADIENAIFWLGQARNEAGLESLITILNSPEVTSQNKKRAVFALSVNKADGAEARLVALAKASTEESIRAEAIFWVAQNKLPQAIAVIEQALESSNSRALHDKAVFALSQIKSDSAWEKLTAIATQHPILAVQKQAVFWLSQNKQRDSSELLINIALGNSPMRIREHAVFALSQLNHGNATKGLIHVLQSANERKIKQKAIFWLGQSKDEEALALIESIVLASN